VMEVENRLLSGQIEVLFKKHVSDKTDWRKMLKGLSPTVDLRDWKKKLLRELSHELENFEFNLLEEPVVKINYPVLSYPEKIVSLNLDKVSEIYGKLIGIKGQYLIFDSGVLNIRSHSGYEITLEEVDATHST
jgi:hypothetical protein